MAIRKVKGMPISGDDSTRLTSAGKFNREPGFQWGGASQSQYDQITRDPGSVDTKEWGIPYEEFNSVDPMKSRSTYGTDKSASVEKPHSAYISGHDDPSDYWKAKNSINSGFLKSPASVIGDGNQRSARSSKDPFARERSARMNSGRDRGLFGTHSE